MLDNSRFRHNESLTETKLTKLYICDMILLIARETVAVVSDTSMKGGVDVEEIISFTLLVMIIILYIKR